MTSWANVFRGTKREPLFLAARGMGVARRRLIGSHALPAGAKFDPEIQKGGRGGRGPGCDLWSVNKKNMEAPPGLSAQTYFDDD